MKKREIAGKIQFNGGNNHENFTVVSGGILADDQVRFVKCRLRIFLARGSLKLMDSFALVLASSSLKHPTKRRIREGKFEVVSNERRCVALIPFRCEKLWLWSRI
jgi:hypothetical protein